MLEVLLLVGHDVQMVRPVIFAYDPRLQPVQMVSPVKLANVPFRHASHAITPSPDEYVPVRHWVQVPLDGIPVPVE